MSKQHHVAITQSTAFKSAEAGAQISRSTTNNNRHIDSSRNCKPASAAKLSATKFQFVTSLQTCDVPRWQCPRSNLHVEFAAAPRDDSIVFKPQTQTTERDFEAGRAFIISNKQIRYAQCKGIERAAGRNAKLAKARAAQILYRR